MLKLVDSVQWCSRDKSSMVNSVKGEGDSCTATVLAKVALLAPSAAYEVTLGRGP
jgi:hypothetical protein